MILKEIVSAPSQTDLTTRDTVKTSLLISGTDDDSFIDTLIKTASSFIQKYCNKDFARTRVIEKVKPFRDLSVLKITNYPVTEIHSVSYNGTALEAAGYITDRKSQGIIDAAENTNFLICGKFYKYEVDYTYGYLLPGEVGRNLPDDIERACVQLVKNIYLTRDIHSGLKMMDVPEVFRGAFAGGDLPNTAFNQYVSPEIKMLLHPYRKFRT